MHRLPRRQHIRLSPLALAGLALLIPLAQSAAAATAPAHCASPGIALQLLVCAAMLIATCLVHLAVTTLITELSHQPRLIDWCAPKPLRRTLAVLIGAGLTALALLLEILLWALLIRGFGLLPTLESSFYFSGITFTSVGYGDVMLPSCWHLLSVGLALNGLLLAGWSTALLVFLVQRSMELRLQNHEKSQG